MAGRRPNATSVPAVRKADRAARENPPGVVFLVALAVVEMRDLPLRVEESHHRGEVPSSPVKQGSHIVWS